MLLAVCPQILAETPHLLSHTHIVYNQDRCKWFQMGIVAPGMTGRIHQIICHHDFHVFTHLTCVCLKLQRRSKKVGFGSRIRSVNSGPRHIISVSAQLICGTYHFLQQMYRCRSVLRSQLAVWFGLKVCCFHLMQTSILQYIASMS